MIKYRLLQRKETDPKTQSEYWFSLAIAVQREDGIYIRQWGKMPFSTKKKRIEALNLLDAPRSLWDKSLRWTEVRSLPEEHTLWVLEMMKKIEPVEREVVEGLLPGKRLE
jgi:hypothetical protein